MRQGPQYFRDKRGALAYQVGGRGECVVLCHALGTNRALWDNQVRALHTKFSTVTFDIRGHGQSSLATDGDYSFESMADDVITLMSHLGVSRASIVGISVGGEIAQSIAARYRDRVRRLLLASTACFTDEKRAALWESRISEACVNGMEGIASAAARRWFSNAFRRQHPDIVEAWRKTVAETPVQGFVGIARSIQAMDLRQAIRGISCPACVICGDQDENTGPAAASIIARVVPQARMHVMQNVGHFPNIEAPTMFNRLLLEWLSDGW